MEGIYHTIWSGSCNTCQCNITHLIGVQCPETISESSTKLFQGVDGFLHVINNASSLYKEEKEMEGDAKVKG